MGERERGFKVWLREGDMFFCRAGIFFHMKQKSSFFFIQVTCTYVSIFVFFIFHQNFLLKAAVSEWPMGGQNINECNCLEICTNKIRLLIRKPPFNITFKGGEGYFF
jgi:hypothetical protein